MGECIQTMIMITMALMPICVSEKKCSRPLLLGSTAGVGNTHVGQREAIRACWAQAGTEGPGGQEGFPQLGDFMDSRYWMWRFGGWGKEGHQREERMSQPHRGAEGIGGDLLDYSGMYWCVCVQGTGTVGKRSTGR